MRSPSAKQLAALAERGDAARDWYDVAHDTVCKLALRTGYCPHTVAAIVAVTSPRIRVAENLRLAERVLRGEEPPEMLDNVRVAYRHWFKTGRIRGPKTREFYHALLGDPNAVVLDTWMAIVLGVDPRKLRGSEYNRQATRVRRAANLLNWYPAETQAAIWHAAQGGPVRYLELDT